MRTILFFPFLLICFSNCYAQDCESYIKIILKNTKGGYYQGQTVKLTPKYEGIKAEEISDKNGQTVFKVRCKTEYTLTISNYSKKENIISPEFENMESVETFNYSPDMLAKEKLFAASPIDKELIDEAASALADTLFVMNPKMETPKNTALFSGTSIFINNIEGQPLENETVCLTGMKRGKSIKGTTDRLGKLYVWLPKGDNYSLNFKHNRNYASIESDYKKGFSKLSLTFAYLGTKEIELRKKIEAERIAAEEKRLKEEAKKFAEYCKKLKITAAEGRKREIAGLMKKASTFLDDVITAVFKRNKWDDKLIVCDLTGSMSPYYAQLAIWYQLHYKKEKNLQFVFFNDGDNMADQAKKIGETGGIYYSKSEGIEELSVFMSKVSGNGSGGDCPENNMEALIKGTKMATPFKELVMIVDNNSPVKDIELLKNFKTPVHIILCGLNNSVMLDYLLIAWKTKGSIHTIEEDITKIASMMEGQDVVVKGVVYRIMGGDFVRITK